MTEPTRVHLAPHAGAGPTTATCFGAVVEPGGVRFHVFAPGPSIALHVLSGAAAGDYQPAGVGDGVAEFFAAGAAAGDRYQFSLDGGPRRPDPASRFQPEGVHGPSEVVDPKAYRWQHAPPGWSAADLVVYELHVGTFTPEGTFAAVRERLPLLRDLGVTAIELMPIAAFPGTRNWGYDGVCLFAPSENYGRPDDLRELVDAAHGLGLAVFLDVVYNHLGPEGAYLPQFCPTYHTDRHETPWGGAINLDGPGAGPVRAFILDNARHWIDEYRFDGLRLDATHALIDTSPVHIVGEIADRLHQPSGRSATVHAEDHRNLASLVEPTASGGWGLDGVWADDFHHVVRRMLAGDAHGYYEDFSGTTDELARTLRQGWLYTGQASKHGGGPRGSDPSRTAMHRFVVCIQNHDQVGNRATGDRLHHRIEAAAWRAASTLLLTAPMTPLLFMGQEWAASAPFQYFTDLEPGLGRLVTEGRRREFRYFPEFADPEARDRIPDPQAVGTFHASRLNWAERGEGVHGRTLNLYADLLRLRRSHAALAADTAASGIAEAVDEGAVAVRRGTGGDRFVVLVRLRGTGPVRVAVDSAAAGAAVVLTTEDPRYALDPAPPAVTIEQDRIAVDFTRPGAAIVKIG